MAFFTPSRWPCRAATLVGLLVLFLVSSVRAGTWDEAQQAFAEYNDAAGLRLLHQAADEGDVRAMQAWGLALLHGPRLFPGLLKSDPARAGTWFDKVAQHCGALGEQHAEGLCPARSALSLAKRCAAGAAHSLRSCPTVLKAG
jgi:TPR repeat protein